jgi:hypothetical protein
MLTRSLQVGRLLALEFREWCLGIFRDPNLPLRTTVFCPSDGYGDRAQSVQKQLQAVEAPRR